jgi:hypothetical protein
LTVEVSDGAVTIDSPVPVIFDHGGQARELTAGRHEIAVR